MDITDGAVQLTGFYGYARPNQIAIFQGQPLARRV